MKAYTGRLRTKEKHFSGFGYIKRVSIVMFRKSIFGNMRTGFSSLEIFQEQESAAIVRFEIPWNFFTVNLTLHF